MDKQQELMNASNRISWVMGLFAGIMIVLVMDLIEAVKSHYAFGMLVAMMVAVGLQLFRDYLIRRTRKKLGLDM